MINVKLLREVLQYIETHPQKWNQQAWFKVGQRSNGEPIFNKVTLQFEEVNSCNTSMCFAGHAALMSGFDAPPKNDYLMWRGWGPGLRKAETMDVDEYAREVLGLTFEQADVLFQGENTLEDLKEIVENLIENPDAYADGYGPAEARRDSEPCGCGCED